MLTKEYPIEMLTRDEIFNMREMARQRALSSYGVGELATQAEQAIDLAAENERLKAKLDAVKAECLKPIMITSDVFGGGVAAGHNILKQAVLAIIKDGEEK